jgi:hypothetical protein
LGMPAAYSLGALRSPPFDVDVYLYEAFKHM